MKAQKGEMDLSHANLWGNVIPLNGEWEFKWGELYSPEKGWTTSSEYVPVPGVWRDYPKHYPLLGHASYRLHLKLNGDQRSLVLKIPRLQGVYSVYLGNRKIFANGINGTDPASTVFIAQPVIRNIPILEREVDLIVNISNYRGNYRKGGIRSEFLVGGANTLFRSSLHEGFRETILVCVIFAIALYHFVFFASYKKDLVPAYFSGLCFLVSFYSFITSNIQYSLISELSPDLRVRMEFFCVVSFFPILYFTLRETFPKQFGQKWMLFSIATSGIFIACIPVLSEVDVISLYSYFMYFPPIYSAILFFGMVGAWRAGEKRAKKVCLSSLILAAAMINDVSYGLFEVYVLFPYSFPIALVAFIVFNSYLISARFTEDLEGSKDFADLQVKYNEQLKHSADEKAEAVLEIDRGMDSDWNSLLSELESREKSDRSFSRLKNEMSEARTSVRDIVFLMNYQGSKADLIEQEFRNFSRNNSEFPSIDSEIRDVSEAMRIDQCLHVHRIFSVVVREILRKGSSDTVHVFWGKEKKSALLRISQGGFEIMGEDPFGSAISEIRMRTEKLQGRYVLLNEKGRLEFELRVPLEKSEFAPD
ncbi:7TM-DISM domain-containing protein [Leptospira fluminis]|nr:7TM-DISM domain-containing protein [Leptospira fluminis]